MSNLIEIRLINTIGTIDADNDMFEICQLSDSFVGDYIKNKMTITYYSSETDYMTGKNTFIIKIKTYSYTVNQKITQYVIRLLVRNKQSHRKIEEIAEQFMLLEKL